MFPECSLPQFGGIRSADAGEKAEKLKLEITSQKSLASAQGGSASRSQVTDRPIFSAFQYFSVSAFSSLARISSLCLRLLS